MSVSQDLFTTALLDASHPCPDGLQDAAGREAGARFDVYRNNVAVSLTEALHTGFPVITKLLGQENMDGLAGIFLRAHPPSSPVLMTYGDVFPEFLEQMPQLSHLGYLGDVARLELALRQAYHAADADPIDGSLLAEIAPETLMASTLGFAPAMQVIPSTWPIFDIWRYNTEGGDKPEASAQNVLITRPEFDPIPQPLPIGGAEWIAALQSGASFGDAHAQVIANTPDFDLGATLTLLLSGGAIISLNTEGQTP